MRFCPKCGGLMVPIKKEGKILLKCQRCGYEIEASKKEVDKYKSVSRPDETAKVVSTKVISKARRTVATEEDIEQAREDYYELVLDQIGEYGD
ncbi:MAG: RPA12/RPB9/RPC11 RNA polymerase family protein [Desulfurococcales archaeon]|nr:RPA12/RPB9/RPC11 RNA polymerase family protein [Desulfurococcales archaeon]